MGLYTSAALRHRPRSMLVHPHLLALSQLSPPGLQLQRPDSCAHGEGAWSQNAHRLQQCILVWWLGASQMPDGALENSEYPSHHCLLYRQEQSNCWWLFEMCLTVMHSICFLTVLVLTSLCQFCVYWLASMNSALLRAVLLSIKAWGPFGACQQADYLLQLPKHFYHTAGAHVSSLWGWHMAILLTPRRQTLC